MPAAPRTILIITTSKTHSDAKDALRLGDWVAAFSYDGWNVDILVPRRSALVQATLPMTSTLDGEGAVRVFTLPPVPFFKRHIATWRAARLISANKYDLVLGLGDGAIIARSADRTTLLKFPYMAEVLCDTAITRRMAKALKHASCVAVPPQTSLAADLLRAAPKARLCTITEPHYDDHPGDDSSFAAFRNAVRQTRDYALERFAKSRNGK